MIADCPDTSDDWGNSSVCFSGAKTINTIQHLDYGGTLVESYFSPTDWPAFEVWLELAQVEETIHLAMFFCCRKTH